MPKLTVQVRTHDNLLKLLAASESHAWVVGSDKENFITNVQIVNWDGTQMIEGVFDPASPRRKDDGRLILQYFDARIVNCGVSFASQNPVQYIQE